MQPNKKIEEKRGVTPNEVIPFPLDTKSTSTIGINGSNVDSLKTIGVILATGGKSKILCDSKDWGSFSRAPQKNNTINNMSTVNGNSHSYNSVTTFVQISSAISEIHSIHYDPSTCASSVNFICAPIDIGWPPTTLSKTLMFSMSQVGSLPSFTEYGS